MLTVCPTLWDIESKDNVYGANSSIGLISLTSTIYRNFNIDYLKYVCVSFIPLEIISNDENALIYFKNVMLIFRFLFINCINETK